MKSKLVTIDPEIMSGEPVFTGTRVPVRNLIDLPERRAYSRRLSGRLSRG